MAKCEICRHVYWKPSSATGLCLRSYCKMTNDITPINPFADHAIHQFKCGNYSIKKTGGEQLI